MSGLVLGLRQFTLHLSITFKLDIARSHPLHCMVCVLKSACVSKHGQRQWSTEGWRDEEIKCGRNLRVPVVGPDFRIDYTSYRGKSSLSN